jgi:2'-5' RNA ligase
MPKRTENKAASHRAERPAILRVFFALWPDASAREGVAALARDVVSRAGGRAPRPENVHLTVAFVGNVEPDRLAELQHIGASAAKSAAPFTLKLDRLGAFHHAGIAWLGADTLPTELEDLVFALRNGLAAEAFPVERRMYRAHVTLARRCGTVATVEIPPISWRVERVTLNASELSAAGSIYRELAAWPLGREPRGR